MYEPMQHALETKVLLNYSQHRLWGNPALLLGHNERILTHYICTYVCGMQHYKHFVMRLSNQNLTTKVNLLLLLLLLLQLGRQSLSFDVFFFLRIIKL